MRRIATLLAFTVASVVSACGQYTNFPARIHISGESNLVGEVAYTTDSAGKVTATAKNPKLVVIGEAGSVGATFDTMNITYQGVPDTFGAKSVNLKAGLRVDSSHNLDPKFDPNSASPGYRVIPGAAIILGKGNMDLPIVSPDVIRAGQQMLTPITAVVTLQGIDDAGWPCDLQFGVPINFIRS